MTKYTFQLESNHSFAVVVAPDYRRAFDIVLGTCVGDPFWLVDEQPATAGAVEGISFLEAG